jgi:hypothetical protein
MSSTSNSAAPGGIGFTGVLAIVFIVLKLLHKIAWSWWWVLSPLWIGTALMLAFLLVLLVVAVISTAGGSRSGPASRARRR